MRVCVCDVSVLTEDDDRVCDLQVDSDTSRLGGQQEDEPVGSRRGESVDGSLARIARDAAVEALVGHAHVDDEVLEQVEDLGELREDQTAVALRLQTREKLAEEDEFAARLDEQSHDFGLHLWSVGRLAALLALRPRRSHSRLLHLLVAL